MADLVFPGELAGGPLNAGAMPSNQNLEIYKGDYVEILVTVKDENDTPINLTGYTAEAHLRDNYPDATPIEFECTITGITGQVQIFLPSSVSSTLVPGDCIWDFQITDPSGERTRTYLAGDVVVYNEVTR